jgi:hypothetical protein
MVVRLEAHTDARRIIVIKQVLVAAALLAGFTAPALADSHHGNQPQQGQYNQHGQTRQNGQNGQRGQNGQYSQNGQRGNNQYSQNGQRGNNQYSQNGQRGNNQYSQNGQYGQNTQYGQNGQNQNMVWQPGYYGSNGGRSGWTPGRYAQAPYQGAQWQSGTWVTIGGISIFISGSWF